MTWLGNFRLSAKLGAAFGLLLAVLIGIGILSVSSLAASAGRAREIDERLLPGIDTLTRISAVISEVRIGELRYLDAKTEADQQRYQKESVQHLADVEELIAKFEKLIDTKETRDGWQAFGAAWREYKDVHTRGFQTLRDGHVPEATNMLMVQSRDLRRRCTKELDKLAELNRTRAREYADAASAVYSRSRAIIVSSVLVSLVLGILIAVVGSRDITGSIAGATAVFRRIAQGDLQTRIETTRRDELGDLMRQLGEMQGMLRERIESDARTATANERIRQGLDSVSACVMVVNGAGEIIYLNPALASLLAMAERDIRAAVPGFSAAGLLGSDIGALHLNPANGQRMLSELTSTHRDRLQLGSRTFDITYNPVKSAQGERLGTVLEWGDRTQELSVESELEQMLAKVLNGDLGERIQVDGKRGFFAMIGNSVNQLAVTMTQIVSQAKEAAREVHRGAEEISDGNTNLSQRTEQQSASLEETASSMEEMTSTVKQNADNAAQASQLAVAARDHADKGGEITARAVRAMEEINNSAKQIADIIAVIDDIAFQTNLLALNAAVEAARAGEQGRGFAVVATEVRTLAGRSATAAKEIRGLIQNSTAKVRDGTLLVSESGRSLEQIVTSVKKVSDIVAEIAAASREQSAGIDQVNKAVMEMDETTQQNAALVEQATAASRAMADQARKLNESLAHYRFGGGDSGMTAAESKAGSAGEITEHAA